MSIHAPKDHWKAKVLRNQWTSYLVMMLDAHADGVNEDGDHDPPAEVLALHDAPKFFPRAAPEISAATKACPPRPLPLVSLLLQVVFLFVCFVDGIIFIFFVIRRVPHVPRAFFKWQCTHGAVVGVLWDRQTDGVGLWAGVLLAVVLTFRCYRDTTTATCLPHMASICEYDKYFV